MKKVLVVGVSLLVCGATAVWIFTAETPEGTTHEASQKESRPVVEGEKRELLATAREFDEAPREEGVYPERVRDPESSSPLDVELSDEMLRLSSMELVQKALSQDARTSLAARHALELDKDQHVRAVEIALEQSDPDDRMLAVKGAQILGAHLFEAQLLEIAESDGDLAVRREATNALSSTPSHMPAIEVALRDASWGVRLSALGAGEQIQSPSPELAQAVVQLLDDSKPVIRKRAHRVLAKWAGNGFGYDYSQSSAQRQASILEAAAWASSLE